MQESFVNPLGKQKKDICAHIRNAINFKKAEKVLKDDQPITEQLFKEFTDLNEIENLVFDKSIQDQKDMIIVRLYIATRKANSMSQKFQAFFASLFTEVGTAHLAVQINDKLIHWFDCGLVLVQPFEGSNATAVFYPIDKKTKIEEFGIENTSENRRKVAEVIQLYNCKNVYNAKTCNCQHFTQDIFKALGFDSEFSKIDGPVGYFLKYITGHGKYNEIFPCFVDKDGKTIIKQQGKELIWKTHEELDNWCNTGNNSESFKSYSSLLKAFHRAFQLKEKYAEKMGEEHYKSPNCPCGMPTLFASEKKKVPVEDFYNHTNTNTSFKIFLNSSFMSGTSGSGDSEISSNN